MVDRVPEKEELLVGARRVPPAPMMHSPQKRIVPRARVPGESTRAAEHAAAA
jgi:hypothetical protein